LCLPPSPRVLVAPLPQKSHTAARVAIFGDPVIFKGKLIIYGRKFTLSAYALRLIEGKNENCDFRFCKFLF
ncbi:MAG TPA: hypothetical protein H9729_00305, partial [Candidatus Borkfalkia excrementigallinarum]|nr:hypothetical protein [Candidatus Borkfalkia excrementigallinarum]